MMNKGAAVVLGCIREQWPSPLSCSSGGGVSHFVQGNNDFQEWRGPQSCYWQCGGVGGCLLQGEHSSQQWRWRRLSSSQQRRLPMVVVASVLLSAGDAGGHGFEKNCEKSCG